MTHSRCLRMSKLTLGLVAALAAAPVFAQSTSAGIGGMVTSKGGQPVVGAEVTITHAESGTVSRAITDASGRYNAAACASAARTPSPSPSRVRAPRPKMASTWS